MAQQDFNFAEQQAIMRAREMYSRAMPQQDTPVFHKQPPPPPPEDEPPQQQKPQMQKPQKSGLFDGDMKLVLAMLLLLSGDGGDTMLLMALMYIML